MNKYKLIVVTTLFSGAALAYSLQGYAQEEPAKAKIIDLSGEVRYKNPSDADWRKAENGAELLEGAHLFAGPDAECGVSFGESIKSVTRVKPDTHVVLTSINDEPRIEIVTGKIFALVKNPNRISTFKVATPTAVAAVRGTAFSFAAEGIASQAGSTLEVYENTVGLSPTDKPENEVPVDQGHGAVMNVDGVIEKQFELSAGDMQMGQEFMREAAGMMEMEKPGPVDISQASSDSGSQKPENQDDNHPGGPTPPGPPSDGPPGGSDPGEGGPRTPGPLADASHVDSAVDGVVMGMAQDTELSRSETFTGSTLNHMMSNLSDLNYGASGLNRGDPAMQLGSGPAPENVDPAKYAETIRNAVEKTDYFQSQPPEVQRQMMSAIDNYSEKFQNGMLSPPPEGGYIFDGRMSAMGDGGAFNTGTYEKFGTGMDPYFGTSPERMLEPIINPNDLASFINTHPELSPQELQSIINFMAALKADYDSVALQGSGALSAYFSSGPRVIPNFSFIKDNVATTGSIVYTPLDGNPGPGFLDDHNGSDPGGLFLHVTNVVVKDDPTGSGGTVIVEPTLDAPSNTLDVPIAP